MTFRFARHTNQLQKIKEFYVNVLGFEILGDFENHNGYDGVFIGKPNLDWHLEFTQTSEKANHLFDEDDILVFYPKTNEEYLLTLEKISKNNIPFVEPKNPYWNDPEVSGAKMILDPDGYRIIISSLKIEK